MGFVVLQAISERVSAVQSAMRGRKYAINKTGNQNGR
jgi:hypothetical protein